MKENGLTANLVGNVTKEKIIEISSQEQIETFMKLDEESIFGLRRTTLPTCITESDVRELSEQDAAQIETLFKKVWSSAYDYPEKWRKQRTLTKEQISKEMQNHYHYFGIKINNKLVGLYKALITGHGSSEITNR